MFARPRHHPQTPSSEEDGASEKRGMFPRRFGGWAAAPGHLLPLLFRGGGRGVVAACAGLSGKAPLIDRDTCRAYAHRLAPKAALK